MRTIPLEKHGEPGGDRARHSHRKHVTYRKHELRGLLDLQDLRHLCERPYAYSTRIGSRVRKCEKAREM